MIIRKCSYLNSYTNRRDISIQYEQTEKNKTNRKNSLEFLLRTKKEAGITQPLIHTQKYETTVY